MPEPLLPGQPGGIFGKLHKDLGFSMGVGNDDRTTFHSLSHYFFGLKFLSNDGPIMQPGILGNIVVFAVQALEILANCADGIALAARAEMK
jgi:aminoglycoside N3'-acetyltransferase